MIMISFGWTISRLGMTRSLVMIPDLFSLGWTSRPDYTLTNEALLVLETNGGALRIYHIRS